MRLERGHTQPVWTVLRRWLARKKDLGQLIDGQALKGILKSE